MTTHAEKTQKNIMAPTSQEGNSNVQKTNGQLTQLVDNRPETILQRRLIQTMNKSSKGQMTLQKKAALEEEGMVQGKFEAIQKQGIEEELQMKSDPIQKKPDADSPQAEAPVSEPVRENNTGLPDNLKSGIENLSGVSLDDVKVHHNSDKPAQLQAHAYAQGTDIHLGPGQEKHLPHEAWHVVQQKQGRVKPTLQLKGKVNVNDDPGLEKEADVMGAKALQKMSNIVSNTKQPSQLKALDGANNVTPIQRAVLQLTEKALTQKALKNVLNPLGYKGSDPRVNTLSGSVSNGDNKVAKIHATQYLANTSQKKIEKDTPISDIMNNIFGGSYPTAHHVTAEVFGEKNPKKNPHYFWDGTYVSNAAPEVKKSDMEKKLTDERDRIETILKRDSWWTM